MAAAVSSSSSRRKEEGKKKVKTQGQPLLEEDDMAAPPQHDRKKNGKNSKRLHHEPQNDGFDLERGKSRNHKQNQQHEQAAAEADGFRENKKKDKEMAKRKRLEQQKDSVGKEKEEGERKGKKQKLRQQDEPDENKKNKKKRGKQLREEEEGSMVGEKKHKNKERRRRKKKGVREGDGEGSGEPSGERRNLIMDARFTAAHSDPRFQRLPPRESKVTIDSRFSRMFSEKGFASSSAPVDKRGKPKKEKVENPLLRYYLHDDEAPAIEEESGEEGNRASGSDEETKPSMLEEEDSDGSGVDTDTSSSTDEDGDDEEDDLYAGNNNVYQFWMANHEDTPTIENETRRLAVVNMDWDHIKAVDLYVLMSTCLLTTCPQNGGQILSVTVYPSEFGLKCMNIEAIRGPHALFDDEKDDVDDADDETDDEIVNEKIRSYQLKRLKYYFAVVECDSSATANYLYNSLDGVEFLRTANALDLRFIPDSMEFKHPPRDIATEAPPDYKHPNFETFALQHTTVKLTWDDDEPDRKKILRQKFNPEKMDELEQYLASDDSDDDDDDDENAEGHGEKYNALLQSADASGTDEDNDSSKEMEVTFLPGVENLSKHIDKNKLKKSEEGVWDAYLRKRREKKAARKKNRKFSSDDDSSDSEYNEAPHQPDDFFVEAPSDSDTQDDKKGSKKGSLKAVNKSSQKVRRHPQEKGREEAREASRAELELLLADDDATTKHLKGFNLRPKKVKGKKGKEVPVEDKLPDVDASDDPRFSSRLTSHLYALDPTDPQYKRSTAGMRQACAQKQQKGNTRVVAAEEEERIGHPADDEKPFKEKQNIMSLVRSLKLKSKVLGNGGNDVADE